MNKTKPYITLIDRIWKDKEWFTSWRSHKNIRKLTEEEAKSLDNIEEVIPPKYGKDIMGVDDGRMFCKKCDSRKGFYIKKRPFGKEIEVFTCANCGIREIRKIN